MADKKLIELGIKTDPIHTRYSYDWLLDLAASEGIKFLQLGSFFELYSMEDEFFEQLHEKAKIRDLRFKSVFTAYRELGGFFYDDRYFERTARKNYERLIHVASIIGADYCGSNPGAVWRDRMASKEKGIQVYLSHMKELMHLAYEKGLKALTMEPMSSLAEPPSTPDEMDRMINLLQDYHKDNYSKTVPVYLCGDVSHGLVSGEGQITYTNVQLFTYGIPYMAEFHFKNTDRMYNTTFGFSEPEKEAGHVDLQEFHEIIHDNVQKFPVDDLVGYLEIGGPKIGRDYSDPLLEKDLRNSLRSIRSVFE